MVRSACVALATLVLAARVMGGQSGQPAFRAGVEVIEVDVSVVDDRGRPITDLLGPEFSVTVDGKPRRVLSAQYVSTRPTGAAAARPGTADDPADLVVSSNAAGGRGRLIVIAVDRESISLGSGRHALHAASRFLATLRPEDKVAFIPVPTGRVVDFTSNHDLVRGELERTVGAARRPRGRLNLGIAEAFIIEEHRGGFAEAAIFGRFCGQLAVGTQEYLVCESEVRAQATFIAQELRQRTDTALRAIASVFEALREIEGPKSLVWVSEGLYLEGAGDVSNLGVLAAAARTTLNIILLDAPVADVTESERSPTDFQDRDLQVQGLEMVAGFARGTVFRVSSSVDAVFARVEAELSGYYLLGVETDQADRDGKRHRIGVTVRRKGAVVRARPEFQVATGPAAMSAEDQLGRALTSPFARTDFGLRLSTYMYRETSGAKVRVLVAAEVDRPDTAPTDVAFGYVVTGQDGQAVVNGIKRETLTPVAGAQGPVLQHLGALVLDPGTYTLRLAVVDAEGRAASLERPLQVWQMEGLPLAVGDLMVLDAAPSGGEPPRPPVEARVSAGRLAAYLELYSEQPESFTTTEVRLEVAAERSGPAILTGVAPLSVASDPKTRRASAEVSLPALRPGSYVVRAIVVRDGQTAAELWRPIHVAGAAPAVTPGSSTAALAPPGNTATAAGKTAGPAGRALVSLLAPPGPLRHDDFVAASIGPAMDLLARERPALAATAARVKRGTIEGAARQAFDSGDQAAAMFLGGLELFTAGKSDQAATRLAGALRDLPGFAPASLYLGACYALAGRDREAIVTWRRVVGSPVWNAAAAAGFADALVRAGQAKEAVAPLQDALGRWPDDDALRRRLAMVHALAQQYADAWAIIGPYLERQPSDAEALLVAMFALQAAQSEGRPLLDPPQARERMERFARGYRDANGAHQPLVDDWLAAIKR